MSNKNRIIVEKEFSTLIKNKLADDRKALQSANEKDKIAHRLNQFIKENLESYDQNLHARAIRLSGGDYPSQKTIERAFFTDYMASIDLLEICGWYIFGDQWVIERKQFAFEQSKKSTNSEGNTIDASEFEAGSDIKIDVDQKKGVSSTKLHKFKSGGKIDINIKQE
ncbi:MAG: hypothetical protein AAFO07_00320 [Bacteroidota bacterium]